ncbi:nucleotidyl transferase AbiEii/AbiGii toxin family protein [Mariniflexile sp. AS56]|uniref:nucleotidyl transferase AbiEii/AbiGii toxin family protein n=1 Tax=Mariniflexile sp. AS56 TaxID=3063957 RepID=UPI0026EBE52E|nr:nucleotidyl transferase AbiEii/AbiGii toxin family protein [Mariniflexile sp. AS56]MDO7173888.1 nucleotidyl transferase AbiEii/AbiGii toxin family protein [Mariniflexile sp. AS56]
MSLIISSDKFTHPLLKPILLELTEYFEQAGISFFVIGATARDIVMELHNEKSGRLTHDLDIAITVNDWEQWQKFEKEIISLENFTKDKDQKQRFLYKDKFQLDIVPFGDIMKQDSKIFWPPDESFAMSVLGFDAAEEASLKVIVDEEIEIKVASLSGIFLLKIMAWKDRHHKNNKDADDIGFILENYLSINDQRAAEQHYELVYSDDQTILTGGALLLGIDILEILKGYPKDLETVKQTLIETLKMKEHSILINQIIETHKTISYEEALKSLQNIINQLN